MSGRFYTTRLHKRRKGSSKAFYLLRQQNDRQFRPWHPNNYRTAVNVATKECRTNTFKFRWLFDYFVCSIEHGLLKKYTAVKPHRKYLACKVIIERRTLNRIPPSWVRRVP
jgi:hypothetical protein